MEIQKGFILGLLFISALVLAAGDSIEKWQVQPSWGKLEPRMIEQVAIDLLGEPLEKEASDTTEVWYYQEVPEREGDKITSRPRFGFLRFRKNGSACLLFDWKEPDWTVITPHTEIQYLAEQRRIETLQKAEEAQKLREEQQRLRQAKAEQLAKERETLRQQRLAVIEQQRQVTATATRNRSQIEQAKIPPAKPDAHIQLSSRYFITIGIFFFIIAFVIAGSYGFRLFKG